MFPQLKNEFRSAGEPVFHMMPESLTAFKVINDLSAHAAESELRLVSTGRDPHLQLPIFTWKDGSEHIIRLIITCPAATQAQFYYQVKDNLQYNEEHSVITNLQPGENEIYLKIGSKHIVGRLRFDPGMVKGEYTITELEIKPTA